MPRFSIVVPAYNAQSTLAETLDAIVRQTLGDWECVVVDDGSTDATRAIAVAYAGADTRIRVLHQNNKGSAGAYNTGVSAALGEFVVICSADDVLLPEHLATMSGFMEREVGFDIYSSNGYFWAQDGTRVLVYGPGRRDGEASLELADVIRVCFYSVGAIYRRTLFERVGGYRTEVFGEDYDFWLRAMASGATHRYLPEPLSLHRLSATQKSAKLESACRSDIRLVTDLRRDYTLTDEELRAVDDCIQERERLIARLKRDSHLIPDRQRLAIRRVVVRLFGEKATRRFTHLARFVSGRGAGRD